MSSTVIVRLTHTHTAYQPQYLDHKLVGIATSESVVVQAVTGYDIVFVQEHWLPSCDLQCLHSGFVVYARSSMDDKYEHGLLRGRPFGGVAVFVRKCYKNVVSFCCSSDGGRVICLKVSASSVNMLFFACYFPVCGNSTQYINSLTRIFGFIDSVININPGFKICVLGDLNFECNDNKYVLWNMVSAP